MNAESVAKSILDGSNENVNLDGHHAQKIVELLKEAGAKKTKAHSVCSKATYEEKVKLPDGRKVTVLNSDFMGSFTDVTIVSA